jgi:hypothetical protein
LEELEPQIIKESGTAAKGNPMIINSSVNNIEYKHVAITADNIQDLNTPDIKTGKGKKNE